MALAHSPHINVHHHPTPSLVHRVTKQFTFAVIALFKSLTVMLTPPTPYKYRIFGIGISTYWAHKPHLLIA
jgi:hypothetical protein